MGRKKKDTTVTAPVDEAKKEIYRNCLRKISKIFDVVQSDEYDLSDQQRKEKLMDTLLDETQKIVDEFGLKTFSQTLFRMMIVPFQSRDSPFMLKIMDFFHILICHPRWGGDGTQINNPPNDTVNTEDGSVTENTSEGTLANWILKMCEIYHKDQRAIVRLRIMQTMEKIIPEQIPLSQMSKNMQQRFVRMLLDRVKDKSEQVRVVSVQILCEFMGENAQFREIVSYNLVDALKVDPEHSVRAKIVSCIKITDRTMEHVVERTGDPSTIVRAAAINRVSESITLASLTMEMREAILKANITADAPKHIEKAIKKLLGSWLTSLENDTCEFLRILNVTRRGKLCHTALDFLFNQPAEEAFEKMSKPLLNEKRYPEESLCIESTYLWLYMYKRFKDEPYVYNKLSLPVSDMIDYINEYIEVIEEEGDLPDGDLAYRSRMLGDLLQILYFLPVEEGERMAVLEFLPELCLKKQLMDDKNSALVVKLISVCSDLKDETNVIDLVNCLLDSDRPTIRKSVSNNITSSSILDNDGSPTQLKIELGNLMHKKKKLERDQDVAVKENDLLKAQACQDEINVLTLQIQNVKDRIQEEHSNSRVLDANETMDEEQEKWIYTNKTMLIVLSIVKTNILLLDKVSDFSRSFCDVYLVKTLSNSKDFTVRSLALELMCIIGLEYEDESSKAVFFCLLGLLKDNIHVKETALKCLFDLVLCYSFSKLGDLPEVKQVLIGATPFYTLQKINFDADDPASTLKSLLLSYIRHSDVELVKISVAGVLKLLFRKEMNSSRLITTFLTNWAIPTQDAQIRFKEVGTIIPVYANIGETEAVEVAKCLLACIERRLSKTHSKDHEPWFNISFLNPDLDKIINLVVKCTDPKTLRSRDFQRCYIAHEAIAIGALEELRKRQRTTEEKLCYAKLLKLLELRQCPSSSISQMLHNIADISESKNRTLNQTLKGFQTHLESLVGNNENSETAENNDDDDDDAMPPDATGAHENDSSDEDMDTA